MRAGDTVHFALHRSTLEQTAARVWSHHELSEQLDNTVEAWQSWSDLHQSYDGPWSELTATARGRVLHRAGALQRCQCSPLAVVCAGHEWYTPIM
jgi:hypothetical protein